MKTIDITTAVKDIVANNAMQNEFFIHMQLQKVAKKLNIAWSREMPEEDVKVIVSTFKKMTGLK